MKVKKYLTGKTPSCKRKCRKKLAGKIKAPKRIKKRLRRLKK